MKKTQNTSENKKNIIFKNHILSTANTAAITGGFDPWALENKKG